MNDGEYARSVHLHSRHSRRAAHWPSASFGCVRISSKGVIILYSPVHIGTHVRITEKPLAEFLLPEKPSLLARAE
jgi:hypothetical protein